MAKLPFSLLRRRVAFPRNLVVHERTYSVVDTCLEDDQRLPREERVASQDGAHTLVQEAYKNVVVAHSASPALVGGVVPCETEEPADSEDPESQLPPQLLHGS